MSGWEGLYEVSDQGEIRSLDRVVTYPDGHTQRKRGRLLKQAVAGRGGGHRSVVLMDGSRREKRLVHRLVMEAFVGPSTLLVLHQDDDGANNSLENLCYGTYSNNQFDAVRNNKHGMARKTHCKRGHEFTPENTIKVPGGRSCKACQRLRERQYKQRSR